MSETTNSVFSTRAALRRWLDAIVLCAAPLLLGHAAVQAQPVFDGATLSEAALVDALAPPEPPACPPDFACRQIRLAAVPPRPRRASVLITFETNSAELAPPARSALDTVARALKADRLAAQRFAIEGHADPRGSPEWNDALSTARARAVRDYLVRTHGVAPDRLDPLGKGSSELLNRANPLAPENRRVTFATRLD